MQLITFSAPNGAPDAAAVLSQVRNFCTHDFRPSRVAAWRLIDLCQRARRGMYPHSDTAERLLAAEQSVLTHWRVCHNARLDAWVMGMNTNAEAWAVIAPAYPALSTDPAL